MFVYLKGKRLIVIATLVIIFTLGWFVRNWALCVAASSGNVVVTKILLYVGITPNAKCHKSAAIHLAVFEGHAEIVKVLISYGADVNLQEPDGYTALMSCMFNRDAQSRDKILELLLSNGANASLKSTNGMTALKLAAVAGYTNSMKLILTKGVELNNKSDDGQTALIAATSMNRINSVNMLIQAGASLDLQDQEGNTALMLAVKKGNYDIAKALIEAGANINIKNIHGETPLTKAESLKQKNITQLFSLVSN